MLSLLLKVSRAWRSRRECRRPCWKRDSGTTPIEHLPGTGPSCDMWIDSCSRLGLPWPMLWGIFVDFTADVSQNLRVLSALYLDARIVGIKDYGSPTCHKRRVDCILLRTSKTKTTEWAAVHSLHVIEIMGDKWEILDFDDRRVLRVVWLLCSYLNTKKLGKNICCFF